MSPLAYAALVVVLLGGGAPREEVPAQAVAVPSLEVVEATGTVYVHLLGAADGPVWLPVDGVPGLQAVQILGDYDTKTGRATVRLGAVAADDSLQPLATSTLQAGRPPAPVEGLTRRGVHWKLALGTVSGVPPECGSCGEVVCCPSAGGCLQCGLCGRTCRKAPGPAPRERPPGAGPG